MENNNRYRALLGTGLLAAMAASLCCILPMIALLLGASGFVSAASWIAPLRPYLSILSILTLAIAWYRKLWATKPHCATQACTRPTQQPSFWQSKKFLFLATLCSLSMLVLPYSGYWLSFSPTSQPATLLASDTIQEAKFVVEELTCISCETRLKQAINQLPGILSIHINRPAKTIQIQFDRSQTNLAQLEKAIQTTGYATRLINNKE